MEKTRQQFWMGKLVPLSWIFLFFPPFSPLLLLTWPQQLWLDEVVGISAWGCAEAFAELGFGICPKHMDTFLMNGIRLHESKVWKVCSSFPVTVTVQCHWCLSVAVFQLCALHASEMTMEGASPLCHSNLSYVPSLRCLHGEITLLPMEDWCLNVPLKVRGSNTGIIRHGWDHFLLSSKPSGGHIYYLIGIFWCFKSFFLDVLPEKK